MYVYIKQILRAVSDCTGSHRITPKSNRIITCFKCIVPESYRSLYVQIRIRSSHKEEMYTPSNPILETLVRITPDKGQQEVTGSVT